MSFQLARSLPWRACYEVLRFFFRLLPLSQRFRIRAAAYHAATAWRRVAGAVHGRWHRGEDPGLLGAIAGASGTAAETSPSGLVSVILPVFNHARLLRDSIESVLAQTYDRFELIIIDDGSTDGVETVLTEYVGNPQIRILRQSNQKLPKALSNGFRFARGEFWTWTSADNLMQPNQLERQVEFLRANPDVALVYADYLAIDDRGRPLSEPGFRFHNRARPSDPEIHLPRTLDEFFARGDNCIGPCFMYRGWVGGLLGDYDAEMGVEDYDYWLRIGLNFRIAHLGTRETLYQYRVHDDSLSGRAAQLRLTGDCERLMAYHARRQDYCKKTLDDSRR